jgi:hypothetical protein
MRYTKPSIVCLGVASQAIQGHGIKSEQNRVDAVDMSPTAFWSTGSAYDLDE